MKIKELNKLYDSKRAYCCKCGCELTDFTGNGLGSVFVLDIYGNYYCMGCDQIFEDYDSRIFDKEIFEDFDPEKDLEEDE